MRLNTQYILTIFIKRVVTERLHGGRTWTVRRMLQSEETDPPSLPPQRKKKKVWNTLDPKHSDQPLRRIRCNSLRDR